MDSYDLPTLCNTYFFFIKMHTSTTTDLHVIALTKRKETLTKKKKVEIN